MKRSFSLLLMGLCLLTSVWAQSITGRVIDEENGGPLQGATVRVKGTSSGALTDANGNYRINLPAGGDILVASYVGKISQEVNINGRSTINFTLITDNVTLEEVVVTGYSNQARAKQISSVAIVGKENIENVALPDLNQIIQGRAPGVLSTSSWGQPGAAQTIRIRGTGSISAGRGPLYVIDGIIMNNGDFTTNTLSNDVMSNLNPNDIESVNVLKDATATALYGARAANGVIVITTRRGREGKTRISLKTQTGVTQPLLGNFEMMNAQEALVYEREVLAASGFEQAEIESIRPASLADVNTDWVDLAFRNGITQLYELSASGGSNRSQFYISGSYYNQEGTLIESDFERYSVLSNLTHKASDKLSFALKLNVSYTNQLNATSGARFSSPILGAFSNSPWTRYKDPVTGALLVGDESDDIINFRSFVQDNFVRSVPLNPVQNFNLRTLGNLTVGYKILKNLSLEETVSIDFVSIKERDFFDPTTPDGAFTNPQGSVTNDYNENITYTTQTLLKGYQSFGLHNIDGVLGFEFQKSERAQFTATGFGVPSPKLRNLGTTTIPFNTGGSGTEFSFLSYLGQINYNYNNRYYFTTSYRRDGSSRFGANNRYADFYSVGGSWRISEEDFLRNFGALSNLKLRASFGTSGNAEIGNFPSLELYSFGGSYNGFPTSGPTQIPNPDLRWEKSEILNIGLDFGFFQNRISATVEVYNKDSKDLLLNKPVSSTTGFTSSLQNVGKLNNKGLEIQVSADPVRTTDFNWTVDFNISFNRNEVVELVDTSDIPNGSQILRVGNPIRSWYIRRWAGANPADGTPLWADGQGGVTGTYDDAPREIVGNAEPDFFGGFTNTLSYRGFSVSAFFYFVQGHEIFDASRFFIDSDGQRFGWGHPKDVAERWQQPGDISDRPEALLGGNLNGNLTSTRYLSDGSYIRLRNLLVSYNIPNAVLQRFKLNGMRIYLQGQNIWTQTDYSGFDPELAENGQEFFRYPNGKSYTFGIDVNF